MYLDWFAFYMTAGGPVMWVILFLSVAGAAVVFERLFFFSFEGRAPFAPEDVPAGADGETLRVLADRRVRAEVFGWQRNLALLEIVIRAAPMLGLLGTVLGMVEMFRVLNVGGALDAAAVTGGIREALFTTVAGLCCAIPLLIAHGLLCAAIDRREERLNRAADAWIRERLKRGGGTNAR
ncbi:MAG: MotA/TolQ/ExbB proton channel family protein [Synergistaceae bacterium]|jgi:biopolymer transport protein ExbB|nr:MotA/TolQ/ExbB proton channel family protein [Synergistaceae bacterium]